jgi:formylglycine-generating enzyme required for sulfatase activity
MEGLTPCYYTDAARTLVFRTQNDNTMVNWSANGYRLPTEAEWEKAARGGLVGKRFPWGDTISHSQANFSNGGTFPICNDVTYQTGTTGLHPTYGQGREPHTSPVGSFAPNEYGLYDMAGNVNEMCWSCYDYYPSRLEVDPRGSDGSKLSIWGTMRSDWMIRGGSWHNCASQCRVAARLLDEVEVRNCGFRTVRSTVP